MATMYASDDRHRAVRLDGLAVGQTLALLAVPRDTEVGRLIAAAEAAVLDLDDEAAKLTRDAHLTPAGRMAQLAPRYTEASAKVQRAEDAARRTKANIAQSMRLVAMPDPLDSTDAVGAALDREIRERVPKLPDAERSRVLEAAMRAEDAQAERISDALARDPLPSHEGDMIREQRLRKAREEGGNVWSGWESLDGGADAALLNIAALREVLKQRPAGLGS
jgi:hypothetical protein